MTPPELIRVLSERGIHISLEGNKLRVRFQPSVETDELMVLVKLFKADLIEYLRILSALKIGMRVESPHGVGRVWELYPSLDRCGILIDGETTPKFFSIMSTLLENNVRIRRVH
jgi:hypothetical protein